VIKAMSINISELRDVTFPGENSRMDELNSITIPERFIQCRSKATGNFSFYYNLIFIEIQ